MPHSPGSPYERDRDKQRQQTQNSGLSGNNHQSQSKIDYLMALKQNLSEHLSISLT
jgi:hypothetical protein